MKSRASRTVLRLALLASLLCACERVPPAAGTEPAPVGSGARPLEAPVLVLAVDAFEWDVALPLLADGRMPNLAGLMRRGSYGTLRTRREARSPRIWTSLATGKPPAQHGILGFTFEEEIGTADGGAPRTTRRLYTSEHRRTKALWNILGDHGVRSATIGWWVTFPVEPVLGLMVAQTNALEDRAADIWQGTLHVGVEGQVFPEARTAQVMDLLRRTEQESAERLRRIFGEFPGPLSDAEQERWEACHWAFRADSTYVRVALEEARRGPPEVTSVYFGGTDIVGHRFWAAHQPEAFGLDRGSREVRYFGRVVRDYYRFVDEQIGRLVAAWPEDTSVFVLSDHGMAAHHPEESAFDPGASGGHHAGEPGLFVACGSGLRAMAPGVDPAEFVRADLRSLGDILDFCPTLLAFLGIPVGEDMPGRPMASLLDREALAAWPLRSVPTHDDAAWLAERRVTGAQPMDAAGRVEALRKLGYLAGEE